MKPSKSLGNADPQLCITAGEELFCAPDPDGDGVVTGGATKYLVRPRPLDGRVVLNTFYHLMYCYLQHFFRCTGIYSTFSLLIANSDDPLKMLTCVVDARQADVHGITRVLHVALTGFGGVLGFDADVRCGC